MCPEFNNQFKLTVTARVIMILKASVTFEMLKGSVNRVC